MLLSTSRTFGSVGPAVLALHGGLGWDSSTLRPWLDPLAEHARLTYVDLLGCGASPEPDDWSAVTNATWAEGVEDVRARLDAKAGGDARRSLAVACQTRLSRKRSGCTVPGVSCEMRTTAPPVEAGPQAQTSVRARASHEGVGCKRA